jgi:DNA-binding CsgD family transcriptional regulator
VGQDWSGGYGGLEHDDPALTPYEARVVDLVAQGWRNHVIAAQLGTTIPAVETAMQRIYTKYGLDDEHDLDKRVTLALRATEPEIRSFSPMGDIWKDDPQVQAWARRVLTELVPKLSDSDCTISLMPRGEADVKFAVELGFSIMLDKPIIAVIEPGQQIPARMLRVVDEVVEGPVDAPDFQERLGAAIARIPE